jgi:hypothetical protein
MNVFQLANAVAISLYASSAPPQTRRPKKIAGNLEWLPAISCLVAGKFNRTQNRIRIK